MTIDTSSCPRRTLMPEDNERVAASVKLLEPGWILHLTALVTLRKSGFCRTGALALLRGLEADGFSLILFDIDCGDTLWLQALSAKTELTRVWGAERRYLVTDDDFNETYEVMFEDEDEEKDMARNIQKACRRLEKRVRNSRRRNSTGGDIPAFPRDGEELDLPETLLPHPEHGASPTPLSRRLTRTPVVNDPVEHRRRNTAPPVLESSGDVSSSRIDMIDSVQEKITKWLERTTESSLGPADSPTVASAPPSVVIHPPAEEDPETAEIEGRRQSSSCPRMCSPSDPETLLVPGSFPTISSTSAEYPQQSSAHMSDRRIWWATIGGKRYRIPDVTEDVSDEKQITGGGGGGFGIIRQAKLRGCDVALKQIKPSRDFAYSPKIKMAESKRFANEVVIAMRCSKLRHKNIVKFKGVAISEELGACLVSPWMKHGNSLEYVNRPVDPHRLSIIRGALEGLAYLHRKGYVHGDIKAQNVLISDDHIPLISDFGLTTFEEIVNEPQSVSILRAGNAQWTAPELDETRANKWTKMSDMWAFGMFAIEILTGDFPFPGLKTPAIHVAKYARRLPPRPTHRECSDILWDLIQRCWCESPDMRVTASQMMDRLEEPSNQIRPASIQ